MQETLLTNKRSVNLCQYQLVRKHSDLKTHRGVLTAVKPGVPFTINDYVDIGIPPEHICDVTVQLQKYAVRVINVYRSPSGTLNINFKPLAAHDGPIVICGDFNARHSMWDPSLTNGSGRKLADHLITIPSLHLLNDRSPTYVGGSALDLTLVTNDLSGDCRWRVSDSLFSDHHAIEVTIKSKVPDQQAPQTGGWQIKRIHWGVFNHHLESLLCDNPPVDDIVREAAQLDDVINAALAKTTSRAKIGVKKTHRPAWQTDPDYRILKRSVNILTKQFRLHRTDTLLLNLRREQKALRKLVVKLKEKSWLKWCSELEHNTPLGEMWRKLKTLEGKAPSVPTHPDPQAEANRLAGMYADRARSCHLPREVFDEQRRLEWSRTSTQTHPTGLRTNPLASTN